MEVSYSFREYQSTINKIHTLNAHEIEGGITNIDIFMLSSYMAGKNSPFPYTLSGNKKAIAFMMNTFIRDNGMRIKEESINYIISRYGKNAIATTGRCYRNLMDLMGPLNYIYDIEGNSVIINNQYIKVFNPSKRHVRKGTFYKEGGVLFDIDGKTIFEGVGVNV